METTQTIVNQRNIAALAQRCEQLDAALIVERERVGRLNTALSQATQEYQNLFQQVIGLRTQVLGGGST